MQNMPNYNLKVTCNIHTIMLKVINNKDVKILPSYEISLGIVYPDQGQLT